MTWIYLAVLAYFINAISFIGDKYLLESPIPKPFVYTFWVSILSSAALVLIPFGVTWISFHDLAISFLSGGSFFVALLFLYKSIKAGDVSVGATNVGVFTAIFSYVFSLLILGKTSNFLNLPAIVLLVIGLFFLSRIGKSIIHFSVLSGLFFALALVLLKLIFSHTTFINGIFWTRMGFVSGALVSLAWPEARRQIRDSLKKTSQKYGLILVLNKVLVGAGFIILYYAIHLGDIALINALMGTQFVFVFLLAILLRRKFPTIHEHVQRPMMIYKIIGIIFILAGFLMVLHPQGQNKPDYGVSFSRLHADELQLDWQETFLAILDLGVKHFRFSAHWPLTEPENGVYNFQELDFQMTRSAQRNASVILAVGRRLPGWPECHVPSWAEKLSKHNQQEKTLKLIEKVVDRYKTFDNLEYWQVENEPYLGFFNRSKCGPLNEKFLDQEIALVRKIDPNHRVLLTDSGELSTWHQAYKKSDVFGTSMYLYVWNKYFGHIRYPITPIFFKIKRSIVEHIYGRKPSIVVELSTEPWLNQPIVEASIDLQLSRMNLKKFDEIINFSGQTGFDTFYLWGAEWWYWLKLHGHPDLWNMAGELFQ